MMRVLSALVLAAVLGVAGCKGDAPVNSSENETTSMEAARIIEADPSEWLSHGRTYSEQRYSPLSAVNIDNIDELGLAWSFDLNASRGVEVTPIVKDGVMYATATWNIVYALDAKTGEKLWEFDPEVDRSRAAFTCCDVVNRGVAAWGDDIFIGTLDGRLISINAKTGEKNWDVLTVDLSKPYTISGAPRVINGKVIIGNGGAEFGVRGYFTAYDAETGKQVWRFYTVPGNPADGFENDTMKMAAETWNGEWWKAGGGGTAWDSMAYDPDLDLLYVGVGNGSPWNQAERSPGGGDNLFLSSIVAVRPDTGEYVWHYQTTPGETWDYTATQHMILADIEIEGTARKVIMQAPKNGFFYVLDRITGEFISADKFATVNWATGVDPETGRPIEVPEARWAGKTPAFIQFPGPLGAHNWQPMSFSPDTGLVYIPTQDAAWIYGDDVDGYVQKEGAWNTGNDFTLSMLPSQDAMFKGMKAMLDGQLVAYDPVKQEPAWTVDLGGPWNGGILSTGGGLVFQGAADANFAAYDAATGDKKWDFFTQTGIVAAPISYEIDGEQYIAVASGWGGAYVLGFGGVFPTGSAINAGRVLVFKIGANGELPALETTEVVIPDIPKPFGTEAMLKTGTIAYANNCASCHGDQAYSSGLTPQLRYSYAAADAEAWQEITMDGALAENGMPNFSKIMDKDTAEAVRAYVVHQANNGPDKAYYESIDFQK